MQGLQIPFRRLTIICALLAGACADTAGQEHVQTEGFAVTGFLNSARQAPGSLQTHATTGSDATDRVDVTQLDAQRFVTMHRRLSLDKAFQIAVWKLDDAGSLTQLSTAYDETAPGTHLRIKDGAIARLSDDRVVVAVRRETGELRVTSWSIAGDGTITRDPVVATGGVVTTVDVGAVSQPTSHAWRAMDVNGDGVVAGADEVAWTPVEWQAVVAAGVASADGTLKLIPVRIAADGVTRLTGDVNADFKVSDVAIAPLDRPFGAVVTAAKDATTQKLRVTAWSIGETSSTSAVITRGLDADVGLGTPGAEFTEGVLNDVAATTMSYRRVAVASTGMGNYVYLWNVEGSGATSKPVFHHAVKWGNDSNSSIDLVNGGGSRLYMLTRSQLRSFEAIDRLTPLDWIHIPNVGGSSVSSAMTVVHPDRPIVVASDDDQKLTVRSFRDLDVPLLRGEWPSAGQTAIQDAPTEYRDNINNYPVQVNGLTFLQDIQIAVGQKAVVVSDGGRVIFYNRAGEELSPRYTHSGSGSPVSTSVSWSDLFASVLTYASGTNPQSLRTHLSSQEMCDPALPLGNRNRCSWGAVDPRVVYDDVSKRFFFMAQYKPTVGTTNDRYQGIAVSKTEDPRDGFYVYMTTEEKAGDMNRITVAGDMVLIGKGEGDGPLHPGLVALHRRSLMNHVITGTPPRIPVSKLPIHFVDNDSVRPAVHYGPGPHAYAFRFNDNRTKIRLMALGSPFGAPEGDWHQPMVSPVTVAGQALVFLGESLGSGLDPDATVHLDAATGSEQKGSFVFAIKRDREEGNRYQDVRTLRMTFTMNGSSADPLTVDTSKVFNLACPEQKDCRMMAATERHGKVLISYMRRASETTFFPSAEFALVDGNTMTLPLLRAGVVQPGLAYTQVPSDRSIDSTGVAPDPIDSSLWLIQDYGKTATSYGAVIGRVRPL